MKKSIRFFCMLALCWGASKAFAGGANLMIQNAASNNQFCMDASKDHPEGNGEKVYSYRCHGRENQRWTITTDENGQSAIIGYGGYCLDVRGAHSKADGTPVQLWKCHFHKNQRFNILPTGQIVEIESGKCLIAVNNSNRAPIVLDTCLNNPFEYWNIHR